MSNARTKIEWADSSWSPVTGCTKVSTGCKNCYAETIADRFWGDRKFTDVRCHPERLDQPLRWRKPRRVFVNSMSDLFHEDVPADFIDEVWEVMRQARKHQFQILTKRPERMRQNMCTRAAVLPNVWLGVSCENQETADERIPILLNTPAAVRFVSAEPLLGPIDLTNLTLIDAAEEEKCVVRPVHGCGEYLNALRGERIRGRLGFDVPKLDWAVVGGESGPGARQCDVAWVRDIVQQCKKAGVAVFCKQLGAHVLWDGTGEPGYGGVLTDDGRVVLRDRKGGDPQEWPSDLRVREWPAGAPA